MFISLIDLTYRIIYLFSLYLQTTGLCYCRGYLIFNREHAWYVPSVSWTTSRCRNKPRAMRSQRLFYGSQRYPHQLTVGCPTMLVAANSDPCLSDSSECQDAAFQGPMLRDIFCVSLKKYRHWDRCHSVRSPWRLCHIPKYGLPLAKDASVGDEDLFGDPSTSHSDQNMTKSMDVLNCDRRLGITVWPLLLGSPQKTPKQSETLQEGDQQILASSSWQSIAHTAFIVMAYLVKRGVVTLP